MCGIALTIFLGKIFRVHFSSFCLASKYETREAYPLGWYNDVSSSIAFPPRSVLDWTGCETENCEG